VFQRWSADYDLVQSTLHCGTVYVARQHWLRFRTINGQHAVLVVRGHVVVQHVVHIVPVPMACDSQ